MRRVALRPDSIGEHSRDKIVWAVVSCVAFASSPALGDEVYGLTEPYRTVEVAASETGVVAELSVREAQVVRRGELLAKLDSEVLVALLAIARQAADSKGTFNSATAELELQRGRLKSYESVFAKGHARQEEVVRARADVAVAEARLLAAQEELEKRRLEYEKVKLQIERRNIRAPMDGTVSRLHKEEGEFLAVNAPTVLTLVQLNPLHAVFSLPGQQARQLSPGQNVTLRLPALQSKAKGTIDVIAPTTDPESGTVLVKIRVDNPDRTYRSGERCSWEIVSGNLASSSDVEPDSTEGEGPVPRPLMNSAG